MRLLLKKCKLVKSYEKQTMKKITYYAFSLFFLLNGVLSCNSNEDSKNLITVDQEDVNQSLNTKFDGKIFSIPSPILTMLLVKKVSKDFHPDFLVPTSNVDNYQSEFKRALLVGVYGADLGYTSMYNEKNKIMEYLVTVEKLTNSLGLESAFDKTFLERYQNNIENSDSMMHIVADAFKNADLFLKSGDRKSVSALMLAGGWTESMHFASALAIEHKHKELIERIGDQNQTLETMISLLEVNNKQNSNDELITLFKDLKETFDKIVITYEYNEPETDVANKTTTLKHTVNFEISEETLIEIHNKIKFLRNYIIE